MKKLIRRQDLNSLLLGALGMGALGVCLGAAMHPNLNAPGEVEGQQIQTGTSGARTYGYGSAVAYRTYDNGLPEYVVGTDWLKPPVQQAEPAGEDAYVEPAEADDMSTYAVSAYEPAAASITPASVFDDRAPQPPRHPSLEGGVAYAIGAAARPAVATEPMETALDPQAADLAVATPG